MTASVALLLLLGPVLGRVTHDGRECSAAEKCVPLAHCSKWCSLTQDKGMHAKQTRAFFNDNHCGFSGKDPMICCKRSLVNVQAKCEAEEVVVRNAGVSLGTCGTVSVDGGQRVANGDDVSTPGAWPWMARLLYQENKQNPLHTHCGGALVSVRHVVTAAHCIKDKRIGEPLAVVLGELDVATEYDCMNVDDECGADGEEGRQCFKDEICAPRANTYKVKMTCVADKYDKEGGGERFRPFPIYDVAVVVLAQPVRFTTFIQPACLPDPTRSNASDWPNQPLVVTGWGNEVEGTGKGRSATVLKELRGLDEISLAECGALLSYDLLESQMCVQGSRENAQACGGDSGGPISRVNRVNSSDPGVWELAGVVSFGSIDACGAEVPLVVTRVAEAEVFGWLKEVVGGDLPAFP